MFIRHEKSIKEFAQRYPAVFSLIVIYLVLWLLDFLNLPIGRRIYEWGIGQNAAVYYGEYWRLLTATFLHAGFSHFLFNSFSLVLFGPALEQMIGKAKFLFIYLGAGFLGNLGSFLMDPTASFYHVGASGAIYGLFGVYIYIVMFRKQLIDPVSAQMIIAFSIFGLIMTFLQPGIHIQAHVFGAIGGYALAPIVLKRVRPIYRRRTVFRNADDDVVEIQFDSEDGWNNRPRRQKSGNILWFILIGLAVLGLLAWF